MPPLPLAGLRVIDLGVVLAGPQGAMLLADLGAEEVRVESCQYFAPSTRGFLARPPKALIQSMAPISGGYPDREPGERPWNRYPWFNATARNKLGMTADLRRPEGLAAVRRLVAVSDVLITNQAPGVMRGLGLGYDAVAQVNDQLVYVDASPYGSTGPYRDHRAYGTQMEASAGHDLLRTYPDADLTSNSWAVPSDGAGGLAVAYAALLGLAAREHTGSGQYVELSMVENLLTLLGPHLMELAAGGRHPGSLGNRDRHAIQGCYPAAGEDRWLVLTVPDDAAWDRLARLVGRPDWAGLAGPARYARHDEVDAAIAAWTAVRPVGDGVAALRAAGVLAGPVLDDRDAMADPHLAEREFFVEIEHADAGRHRYPGPPFRLRGAGFTVRYPPVRLGEHNAIVYGDLLGYAPDEIAELTRAGHIGEAYAPEVP